MGSVQIPNGKGTALHWSNGRGRPEAQVIKTEKKWKAGNLAHGEEPCGDKVWAQSGPTTHAAHIGFVPITCYITLNLVS